MLLKVCLLHPERLSQAASLSKPGKYPWRHRVYLLPCPQQPQKVKEGLHVFRPHCLQVFRKSHVKFRTRRTSQATAAEEEEWDQFRKGARKSGRFFLSQVISSRVQEWTRSLLSRPLSWFWAKHGDVDYQNGRRRTVRLPWRPSMGLSIVQGDQGSSSARWPMWCDWSITLPTTPMLLNTSRGLYSGNEVHINCNPGRIDNLHMGPNLFWDNSSWSFAFQVLALSSSDHQDMPVQILWERVISCRLITQRSK